MLELQIETQEILITFITKAKTNQPLILFFAGW